MMIMYPIMEAVRSGGDLENIGGDSITHKWLDINGFPKGKVFLAIEQSERIKIAEFVLSDENIVLGIGDRWDDNQLHLILGCKSVIVKEYQGDFEFINKYIE